VSNKKNLDLSNYNHKTKVNQRLNIVVCLTINIIEHFVQDAYCPQAYDLH